MQMVLSDKLTKKNAIFYASEKRIKTATCYFVGEWPCHH